MRHVALRLTTLALMALCLACSGDPTSPTSPALAGLGSLSSEAPGGNGGGNGGGTGGKGGNNQFTPTCDTLTGDVTGGGEYCDGVGGVESFIHADGGHKIDTHGTGLTATLNLSGCGGMGCTPFVDQEGNTEPMIDMGSIVAEFDVTTYTAWPGDDSLELLDMEFDPPQTVQRPVSIGFDLGGKAGYGSGLLVFGRQAGDLCGVSEARQLTVTRTAEDTWTFVAAGSSGCLTQDVGKGNKRKLRGLVPMWFTITATLK